MNKSSGLIFFLCLLAGQAGTAFAQPAPSPPKPAWKWTEEERLAARFDAQKQAERNAADVAAGFTSVDDANKTSIVGKTHPELLMPGEIFGSLISSAFMASPEYQLSYRESVEEKAPALGLGASIWDELKEIVTPVLEHERKRRELVEAHRSGQKVETGSSESAVASSLRGCALRAEALQRLIDLWGRETTLRFLYEVIAPRCNVTNFGQARSAEVLRFVEAGCPS